MEWIHLLARFTASSQATATVSPVTPVIEPVVDLSEFATSVAVHAIAEHMTYEDRYFKAAVNDNEEYSGTFVSIRNISTKIEVGTH